MLEWIGILIVLYKYSIGNTSLIVWFNGSVIKMNKTFSFYGLHKNKTENVCVLVLFSADILLSLSHKKNENSVVACKSFN